MFSVDDLFPVLRINNPEEQSTCIGYRKDGRKCRNPVAAASRFTAICKLEDICEALPRGVSYSMLKTQLQDVAKLLHCKRWHQDQAPEKTQEWCSSMIEYVEKQNMATRHAGNRPERSSRSAGRQLSDIQVISPTRTAANSPLSSIRDGDLLRESHFETQTEILRTLNAILARLDRVESRTAISPPAARPGRSGPAASSEGESSSEEQSDGGESNEDEGSSSRRPSASPSRLPSSRSNNRTSSTSIRDSSETETETETECGICLSQLPPRSQSNSNNSGSDIWRCTTCHNATHAMCFDEWMARSANSRVTCIYCRSPVSTN